MTKKAVEVYETMQDEIKRLEAEVRNVTAQKDANATAFAECRVERLRDVIRFHAYLYYHLDRPEISDSQYDDLWRKLQQIEHHHPELVTEDSPTQLVGVDIAMPLRRAGWNK